MMVPIASLVIGVVTVAALFFQASLWLRYSFGARRLRQWGIRLGALDDVELRLAVNTTPDCNGWLKEMIRTSVAALGITTGSFRVEHALGMIEEREERLFRHVFARFCLGAMMVLGLAGTFLSFVQLISTSGLTGALTAISKGEDVSAHYSGLSASFLQIYGGFGHAFISSLAGLIATLILCFVDQVLVVPARTRFLHQWVYVAHDLERRLLREQGDAVGDPALKESAFDNSSLYSPPIIQATPPPEDASTEQKWEVLVKSLEESHVFFDHCLNNLSETAQANREEMQKLVAEVVVSMREVVADLGKQVIKVSEAKADHLKKVDDSIQDHFAKRERIWQDKLQETLDAFKQALQESAKQSQTTLDSTRKDALEAGERVAKAVQKEAQTVLSVITDNAKQSQSMLESTRKDALEAGERVANAVQKEAQTALSVITNNQKALLETQQELHHASGELSALVGSVVQIVRENKQAVETYVSELTLSLKPWKNAPKSIDEALKKTNELQAVLADAIKKMSSALEKTAQMPNRWETEIKDLSGLFSEVAERRRADSFWYQLQSKAKDSTARMKAWFQGKRR